MTTAQAQFTPQAVPADLPLSWGYLDRSPYTPLVFLPSTLLCGLSWISGGISTMTDIGFLLLTLVCIALMIVELVRFPRRFGIGGFVLYGGVLIWFCHDYMQNFFGQATSHKGLGFPPDIVAKTSFFHCLFIFMMSIGLLLPVGRWLRKTLNWVPEPTNDSFYLWIVLFMFVVGLSPYVLFTVDPWYVSIWKDMIGGRSGGASWTVGRTGNINTSWGGYVAQIQQIGKVGGQFAVFYALLLARRPTGKIIGWSIWTFWLLMAFGSGTRSQVAFMALPAIALIYLKYQAQAAAFFRSLSWRAYLGAGALAIVVVFLIQFQAMFRNTSYLEADLADVKLTQLEGNSMFSEGMIGYGVIPQEKDFFYNRFPGEMLIRPLPQTLFNFLIGPIPRVLWTNKPVDPVWEWYNAAYLGTSDGREGTTIATGLVGSWYFPYGFPGVIQGGLLVGWLLALCERILQNAQGRALVILLALALADWLFRIFRAMNFSDLYMLMIGWSVMFGLIYIQRILTGGSGGGSSGGFSEQRT